MTTSHADPLIGRTVEGRYRVLEHLADGGMGSVYVARDLRLDREVALKVLRADLARDPVFVERFQREARAAARLAHPHVVAVHDQGQDADVVYLAMELVRGRTLRDVIRDGDRSVGEQLTLFEQLLDGLAAAHRAGFVHRDIKPENVLIDAADRVKVADFGLARAVTGSGVSVDSEVLIGTASYLSPEQVEPSSFSPSGTRSDVYSAGLVLFEMLTGHRAFDGDLPVQVAYQHVYGTMAKPSEILPELTAAFDPLLARACSKEPQERPADAEEFKTEVTRLRAELPDDVLDVPVPPAPPSSLTTNADTQHTRVSAAADGTTAPVARASSAAEAPDSPLVTRQYGPQSTTALPSRATVVENERPRRWWPWVLAVAALVVAVVAAIAFTVGPLGPRTVPKVQGQAQGQAVSTLRNAGFDVKVRTTESDTVPTGRAVRTTPESGASRRPTSDVTLWVSTGPRMVDVPDTANATQDDARKTLESKGFKVARVEKQHSDIEKDKVVGTNPAGGSRVRHDTPITLIVSDGPAEVDVPDVSGSSEDDAKRQLEALGFSVTTTEDYDPDIESGKVVSTDPSSGTTARAGSTVTLTVSKGPEMVDVPDVVGMSAADARRTLEDAGFDVDGGSWLDDLLDGTVSSQSPEGGSGKQAPKGSTVTLNF